MRTTPLLTKIENHIRDLGAICTVLDTSADVFGGDEINRSQVRQFIGLLKGICLRTGSTILLLSHPSVAGMQRHKRLDRMAQLSPRTRLFGGRPRMTLTPAR
jgi:RecA-family ATPase